jgi:hypothetical protein
MKEAGGETEMNYADVRARTWWWEVDRPSLSLAWHSGTGSHGEHSYPYGNKYSGAQPYHPMISNSPGCVTVALSFEFIN